MDKNFYRKEGFCWKIEVNFISNSSLLNQSRQMIGSVEWLPETIVSISIYRFIFIPCHLYTRTDINKKSMKKSDHVLFTLYLVFFFFSFSVSETLLLYDADYFVFLDWTVRWLSDKRKEETTKRDVSQSRHWLRLFVVEQKGSVIKIEGFWIGE